MVGGSTKPPKHRPVGWKLTMSVTVKLSEKLKTGLSRCGAMFGQPYLGTQHTHSCRISIIHRCPVCLLSGQNLRVYKGKRPRHNWSNWLDRAISHNFRLARNRLSPSKLVFRRNMFFFAFQTISTRLGIFCRNKIFFGFTMKLGWT